MKRLAYLHPFLVAAAFVLMFAAHNIAQIDLEQALVPTGVALLGTMVALLLVLLFFRNLSKVALTVTVALVAFFTYGRFFEWYWTTVLGHQVAAHGIAITLFVSSGVGLTWLVWKSEKNLYAVSAFLSATGSLLVLLSIYSLVAGSLGDRRPGPMAPAALDPSLSEAIPILKEQANRPDIYYIILDGYLRGDMLQSVYEFDNREFLDGLEERGFYVGSQSWGNYATTFLSLASSLHLKYLHQETKELVDRYGVNGRHRMPFHEMIRRPRIAVILKSLGYRYVTIPSNWGGTERSYFSDISYSYAPLLGGEFWGVLLRTTALCALAPSVAKGHRFAFRSLEEIPLLEGPTFTFAHILLPHHPHVFDSSGTERDNVPLSMHLELKSGGWQNRDAFIDQLRFLNRRITEVVDKIKRTSPYPPIIILQADHGSARTAGLNRKTGYPLPDERLAILNAIHASPQIREQLYPSISPVNTFRLILNVAFGQEWEILPDRQIFSWYNAPYRQVDVTEKLIANSKLRGP